MQRNQSVGDHLMSFRVKTGDNLALMAFYFTGDLKRGHGVRGKTQSWKNKNNQVITYKLFPIAIIEIFYYLFDKALFFVGVKLDKLILTTYSYHSL